MVWFENIKYYVLVFFVKIENLMDFGFNLRPDVAFSYIILYWTLKTKHLYYGIL